MANDRIVVDSAALQNCVSQYRGAMDMVLDAVQMYVKSLQALGRDYTGVAAAAMAVKVVKMTDDITTAAGRCADAISELQYADTAFDKTESDAQGKARAVDEGTPFSN